MSFLHNLTGKILRKKPYNSGINPSIKSQQPILMKPSASSQPKTLAELEQEMEAQTQVATYRYKPGGKAKSGIGSKIIWTAILIGVPVGVVWVANLPYPVIRRPVAQNAPILLLPSYMSMDSHYRQAIAAVEQAEQLIEKATSPADLELGEVKVKQAQQHLDTLPIWLLNDWSGYNYWWYDSRFSVYGVNAARTKAGQLEAKVFQEKNAQTLLTDSEQVLNRAKQQYQQALTITDKQAAIAAWRSALNQLEQVPSQTLAGKTAHNQLDTDKQEFQEVVGLAAGNQRISVLIAAARQFSEQAAKAGQNPPHTVTEWQQVENLWQQAINRLKEVPSQDLAGYAEAQKSLAIYEANLGQIKIRRQAEQDSVYALEMAQQQSQSLLASIPADPKFFDRNRVVSQLQSIINQLEKVQNGTTAYLKAQELLLSAKNKLQQLQRK